MQQTLTLFTVLTTLTAVAPMARADGEKQRDEKTPQHAAVLFADDFKRKLGDGWTWLREVDKAWRLRDGGLEIHVLPGNGNTVKNALLRDAPDRHKTPFAVEVTISNEPTKQWEQAGIMWYRDGRPVVKLVKELVDGELFIVLSGAGHFSKTPMKKKTVRLRLEIDGDDFRGKFQPAAKGDWKDAGGKTLPKGGKSQISIQCYHGPEDAEHWIRFEKFRVVKLEDKE